jgi:hypothetical protein
MKGNFRKENVKVAAIIYIRTILMLIIWKAVMDVPGFPIRAPIRQTFMRGCNRKAGVTSRYK